MDRSEKKRDQVHGIGQGTDRGVPGVVERCTEQSIIVKCTAMHLSGLSKSGAGRQWRNSG